MASVRTFFEVLQQACSMRHSLSLDALATLLCALLVSKLDYCKSTLVGVSGTLQLWVQSALNAMLLFTCSTQPVLPWLHCVPHPVPCWNSSSEVDLYWCLHSSSISALIPSARWITLHDGAFPVAVAQATWTHF